MNLFNKSVPTQGRALRVSRVLRAKGEPKGKLCAIINCPDGKQRNMGRVDRKVFGFYFAPRAWYYRNITFPRIVRNLGEAR